MNFIIDECTGPSVAAWLNQQGHNAFSVYENARGETDNWILNEAIGQNRILITNDKDFGDMLFRTAKPHCGVILLRLANETASNKIKVLQQVLARLTAPIDGQFIVATENKIRISRFP